MEKVFRRRDIFCGDMEVGRWMDLDRFGRMAYAECVILRCL